MKPILNQGLRRGVLGLAGAIALMTPAVAMVPTYDTEPIARLACGANDIVYVDLDSWRYYAKGHPKYGVSGHGKYACENQAGQDYVDGRKVPPSDYLFSGGFVPKANPLGRMPPALG